MKKLSYLTAALALVALSAACSKVSPVEDIPVAKTITISATLPNAATKVSFDASFDANGKPTGMSHTWEAGDQLLVTDSSDPSVSAVFDLVDGIGTADGKFEGEGFTAASYDVEVIPNGTFVTATRRPRPRTAPRTTSSTLPPPPASRTWPTSASPRPPASSASSRNSPPEPPPPSTDSKSRRAPTILPPAPN